MNKTFITSDIEIAYNESGKGKQTILFIHGLGNHKGIWNYTTENLSKKFRCIAIDLPGNGNSSHGNYPYSMFFYAECLKKLIDVLQLETIHLVGHSMGGHIAMVFALRYPHLVSKLVLIAASGLEYFSELDKMMVNQSIQMGQFMYSNEFYLENAIKQSFYRFDHKLINKVIDESKAFIPLQKTGNWQQMITASINGMLSEQVQQFLPQINQETLIIFGENDAMIPNLLLHPTETVSSIAKKAEALIENSEVLLLKNAGHFVQIEKSDEVNAAIQAFIEKQI
ncbi:MAG: alpha/beta hydrolase [Bacteroidota bacterium]